MDKQDKQRLYIISAVLIVAVILLFLLRRGGALAGTTVINQAGDINIPSLGGVGGIGDLPSLGYTAGDYNSNSNYQKPCGLCYSGYSRIYTPAPPASREPVPAAAVYDFIVRQTSRPGVWMNSSGESAPRPAYADPTGRFW